MNTFILADNQELTSLAVRSIIDQYADHTVIQATRRIELLNALKENPESVIVTDFELFDFDNAEQMLVIGERFSKARWVLLSNDLTADMIRRVAYASAAFSVVFKDDPLSDISYALGAAKRGERHISHRAMELILNSSNESDERELLTPTEKEITILIALGKTSKEIAAERILSVHTVNTHKKNIFRKLKVNTAHEVTRYALRAGLIDSSEFYI